MPGSAQYLHPLRLQQVLIKPRKTAAVHRRQSEGGLLTLVNTCGEIGLCTPCTEAHPPWRVCPPRAVRGGRGRTGGVAALHTPCGEDPLLPAWWVEARHPLCAAAAATHRAGRTHPPWRVCLCARCAETSFPRVSNLTTHPNHLIL